ncbi:hypothetical protein GGR57DRAFT_467417 [Xylariaceae sp. FL1272]|nr:hypothetical protein GGR57DRAFT_467417 [Xylariaceae sp. FL1272]
MSSLRDQLWATAKAAFEEYGNMTPESVIAYRSPDCVHRTFPGTVDISDLTNKQYSDFVMQLKNHVSNFRLVIQDDFGPLIDEPNRQVIAHIKSAGDTSSGPIEAEYFMALKMNGNGTEIVEFVEFIDTAKTLEFLSKLKLEV